MSKLQNQVSDSIKAENDALRTFRKNQEAMVIAVEKRVAKLEGKREFAITDLAGYSEVFNTCADLVESSNRPKLAAAALLNAVISINLATMGADALAATLRTAADLLPAADAKAKNKLS